MERDLPPIHPGEVLLEDFLKPMGITAYRLAKDLHVPATRIAAILKGRRGITADTALRLGKYFGTTPRLWLNLQVRYDLEVAEEALSDRISREVGACKQLAATG